MSGTRSPSESKYVETLITRDEAAKRMCLSIIEFRRRQKVGDFIPAKKGTKGEWLFRLSDIEMAREKHLMRKDHFTPEQAAQAFKMLEAGKTPIECVIEMGSLPPKAMEEIMLAYASLKESIFLKSWTVNEINKLPLDGPFPLRDENDVLVAFRTIADEKESPPKCLECDKRPREFCKTCVKKALNAKLEEKVADEMSVGKEDEDEG